MHQQVDFSVSWLALAFMTLWTEQQDFTKSLKCNDCVFMFMFCFLRSLPNVHCKHAHCAFYQQKTLSEQLISTLSVIFAHCSQKMRSSLHINDLCIPSELAHILMADWLKTGHITLLVSRGQLSLYTPIPEHTRSYTPSSHYMLLMCLCLTGYSK